MDIIVSLKSVKDIAELINLQHINVNCIISKTIFNILKMICEEYLLAKDELTQEQIEKLKKYDDSPNKLYYSCIHIYGPAGSGKTYVYFQSIN